MNRVMIDLGFFQIKWYSFFIFLAMLTACIIIFKESRKKEVPEEYLTNLLFYGLIIGLVGARLYYVLFNLNYYLSKPSEILMVWNGGLAIHGGIIAALIFLVIYSRKNKINKLLMSDIIVVGLIVGQAIGRWGNFFNSEAFGRIVTLDYLESLHLPQFLINGMFINGEYREPTFLYESAFSLLGFIIMLLVRKWNNIKTGQLTALYLIWYGTERLIIESFRADSLMLGNIKVAQLVSLIAIISGIIIMIISIKKKSFYKNDKIMMREEICIKK